MHDFDYTLTVRKILFITPQKRLNAEGNPDLLGKGFQGLELHMLLSHFLAGD